MMKIVGILNGFFWSWGIAIPLLLVGLFFTILLKCPWARMFKRMIGAVKSEKIGEGASAWDTLCAVVGGQVGSGNVTGVGTAIASGGPGALFWMWITALLGMGLMAAESALSQLYKEKDGDAYKGGCAYYIANGMKVKWLAAIVAIIMGLGVGCILPAVHISAATTAVVEVIPAIPTWIVGVVLIGMLTVIHLGGFKRVAEFAGKVVPFMCVFYIGAAIIFIICNITKLPATLAMIFSCAFTPRAVLGGAAGYAVKEAFRYGVARGLFSNEAGEGTVAYLHAASSVRHPVTQGLLGAMGVAIDTLFVCTATGMVVLMSGVNYQEETGAVLVQKAFASLFGVGAKWVVALALLLFCFTTLITATYIGHSNFKFVVHNKTAFWVFFAIQMVFIMFSGYIPLTVAFDLVDMFLGLFTLFNLIAMVFLWKQIKFCFDDYDKQIAAGENDPIFDWDSFRKSQGLKPFDEE